MRLALVRSTTGYDLTSILQTFIILYNWGIIAMKVFFVVLKLIMIYAHVSGESAGTFSRSSIDGVGLSKSYILLFIFDVLIVHAFVVQ